MTRRFATAALTVIAALALSGCGVVGATTSVVGAAVGVASTTVSTAGSVVGGAVSAVTPD